MNFNSSKPKLALGGEGCKEREALARAIDCRVTNACKTGTPCSYENKAGSDTVV